jgi:hypothetical protein
MSLKSTLANVIHSFTRQCFQNIPEAVHAKHCGGIACMGAFHDAFRTITIC